MRGLLSALLLVASLQTGLLGEAADALRSDPVYVHPDAERSIPADAAESLRAQIAESGQPLFVAILPDAAVDETGGDVDQLPAALGDEVGLAGTYAVVAGERFRAASSALPEGQAGALATAAFQANAAAGTEAVLEDFVTRVAEAAEGGGGAVVPGPQPTTAPAGGDAGEEVTDEPSGNGGVSDLALLGLLVAGGGGFLLWQRSRRRREEAELRRATAADRQMLLAELSVLGDDVMALEHQVTLHPEARPDYDAGVSRFRAAHAALDYADDEVDLVRVDRVIEEGRYAMSRARARIEGREPPAPPPDLTRRGRHDEPPVELDERGEPVYAGYGPFYGGGWYGGGGGGLFSGLLLGSMLSPWGWGGMWGGGLGGGDEIHVDGGDGGDWGGDFGGGGDWGGDFGGDIGGGDWG